MVDQGTLVIGATTITFSAITQEKNTIRAGLIHGNYPTLSSDHAQQGAVLGRGREIILKAVIKGTRAERENAIETIEDWVNEDASLQDTAKYYPVHYPTATTQSGTGQAFFFYVLCDTFGHEYNDDEPGHLTVTMVLREGTKLGAFSSLAGGS